MNNTNENSLAVVKNHGIIKKVVDFFRTLFVHQENNKSLTKYKQNNDFLKSIKIEPDKEKEMLLKIQDEIEKKGINKTVVLELTKQLTLDQKNRLKELYKQQIKDYEESTENYRKQIIEIKKKLA